MYQKIGLCVQSCSVFQLINLLFSNLFIAVAIIRVIRSRRLLKGIVQTHPQSLVRERKTIKKWSGSIGVMHGLR